MTYNSFLEKQQSPTPGPLDAEFHILQLQFGDSALQPQELLKASQELTVDPTLLNRGFYTDIPPRLGETIEESEQAIEVAVRRSFDFMKLPIILGGSSEILPAVFRGIEGQIPAFTIHDAGDIIEEVGSVVLTFDADSLPAKDQVYTKRSIESIGAIIVTGDSQGNEANVIDALMNFLLKAIL